MVLLAKKGFDTWVPLHMRATDGAFLFSWIQLFFLFILLLQRNKKYNRIFASSSSRVLDFFREPPNPLKNQRHGWYWLTSKISIVQRKKSTEIFTEMNGYFVKTTNIFLYILSYLQRSIYLRTIGQSGLKRSIDWWTSGFCN